MNGHAARLLDDEQASLLVLGDGGDRSGDDRRLMTMRDVAQQVVVADHIRRVDLLALDENRARPNSVLLSIMSSGSRAASARSTLCG